MQFSYVYMLKSVEGAHYYVGRTNDLATRLAKHNAGEVPHTSKYVPWRIEAAIAFRDDKKALQYEKYLKSHAGREYAKRHF